MAAILKLLIAATTSSVAFSAQGTPWPMPQVYITGHSTLLVPDNFTFESNLKGCDVLDKAFERYKKTILQKNCALQADDPEASQQEQNGLISFNTINVNVSWVCEYWPTPNMLEEYILEVSVPYVPIDEIHIFAPSVWGALRALETLSQLVYLNEDSSLVINSTYVLDFPRFSFRGMMLDTSRHFVPLTILLQNLDAMEQNKLNVFHWHIVDDQSFPYQSVKFPNLNQKGAFDPQTHIYTVSDIAHVIDYARQRGIRVVSEFDTPGHTQSWGPGQPGLLTPCYKSGQPDGTYGPINPTVNSSYAFLGEFLSEVAKLFPDQYMHLGGDEVSFSCWKSNPDVLEFMKQRGFGDDFAKLEEFYEQNLIQIVSNLGKSFLVWEEVFRNNVTISKDTVIHIWIDQKLLSNVTKAGYSAILSSCWYLNYINYGVDWPRYYQCDPWDFDGTDSQKALVIGGAACMWGECTDGSNLISTTWPRACAVAERLWSSANLTNTVAATPRLEEQRCRMLKRGLNVQPANGPGFCPCDIYF